jgi:hypothetical protein
MSIHPLTFPELACSIEQVHAEFSAQASRAVNVSLTLRNWMIGYYIEEYERLMDRLAETLSLQGLPRCERRELYRYRTFYLTYPRIVESLSPQFTGSLDLPEFTPSDQIVESVTPQFRIRREV